MNHCADSIPSPLCLTASQARAIVQRIGYSGPVDVTEVTRNNHVWRIRCGDKVYFLKTFTKDWYGADVSQTAYCVEHEQGAYNCLKAHGVPTVEVVLACPDCDNPLSRPFIVTEKLQGDPLMTLLAKADTQQFQALLEATGDYLRQMHTITFAYPGYIVGSGPTAPPDQDQWQHTCWTSQQTQTDALVILKQDRHRLSPELADQLHGLFSTMEEVLAPEFQPPRFVQTNCHSHHYFLFQTAGEWQVSGSIDMEVASAGGCIFDLVAFGIEMAAFHPATTHWWEPFFGGYGNEPDFNLFRLQMLGFGEASFKCFGGERWSGSRQQILARLMAAKTWNELFTP